MISRSQPTLAAAARCGEKAASFSLCYSSAIRERREVAPGKNLGRKRKKKKVDGGERDPP